MIGFLIVIAVTFMFMMLGYSLLMGTFFLFMNIAILISLVGMVSMAVMGLLWEFYFQQPAKLIIKNRRAASWEWVVDDLGYAQLVPSRRYLPQGLVEWLFGWCLLPRPLRKIDIMSILTGKRKLKNPDDPEQIKKEEDRAAKRREKDELLQKELLLAEQIALKKCTWKGMGKPIWFCYAGLTANFSPYMLVPDEMKQDNPHSHFTELRGWLNATALSTDLKTQLTAKLTELEKRMDHVRVVIDPRKFKEIVPSMYTNSQLDDHGRIHFRLGQLSVSGIPVGRIILLIVVVMGVLAAIAAVYFLFLKPQQTPQPQQTAGLIGYIRLLLQDL